MIVITLANNKCGGSIFISKSDDLVEALRDLKQSLNLAGDHCKIVFINETGYRQLAVVDGLWSPSEGTKWALLIEWDFVGPSGFANGAVQW